MKKSIAIMLVAFIWICTSCASTSGSRYREGDNTGQQTNLTVADEERLTQEALPKMRKDYPPANNPELQRYVSQLGMKIVRANNLEGNPYHYDFTVVDVKNVNAFALPAGKVFVTAPLIAMASSEAELAGVIGHEIGHVKARHAAERMYAMEKAQNKTWLYAAAGGAIGAAAGLGLGLILCRSGDAACLARAAILGGAVGAGGGLLVQRYTFLANSREDEMEADRIGFRLAVGAGYDKDQVGRFYEKLLQMEKSSGNNSAALKSLADAMSTHPPSEERVKQMHELAAASPDARGAVVNTLAFARAKQIAAAMQKNSRQ